MLTADDKALLVSKGITEEQIENQLAIQSILNQINS